MAAITVDLIKKLREKTQVGMMDCKKALIEANGDFDQAVESLRKKGASVAAKRAGNATDNGTVGGLVSPDYTSAALVEVSCETDFSANTEDMHNFVNLVAQNVLAGSTDVSQGEDDITALMAQTLVSKSDTTLQATLDELISRIAESIKVTKFVRMSSDKNIVNTYIHAGANLGVIAELEVDSRPSDITPLVRAAKDVCMQAAVTNPMCVNPEEVDAQTLEKEKEIFKEQLRAEGKPEAMLDKIVLGKLNKYYEGVCLSRQKYIKEEKMSVQAMLDAAGKEAGCAVKIKRFVRFAIGE